MFANNDLYALLSLPRPPGSPLCSSPAPDAGSRARAAEPGSAGLGSAPQPSRAGLCCQQRSPRALPLSPGSVTIYSAPDERGDRSIFSSVQKVPIYLGAPVLSRLPVRAGSECHRAVPREGGTKTPQGRGDTQRQGPRKSQTLKEKSFLKSKNSKSGGRGCSQSHGTRHRNRDALGLRVRDGSAGRGRLLLLQEEAAVRRDREGSASFHVLISLVGLHRGGAFGNSAGRACC